MMGRRRKSDKHLPRRVYHRHGAYYYAAPGGKWHRLAKDYPGALRALALIVKSDDPPVTVDTLIARYELDVLAKQAERTRQTRAQEFRRIRQSFGPVHPGDIEPSDVWKYWMAREQIEQARHEIRALSAVLSYGRKLGVFSHPNPCFGLNLPSGGPRRRYVTDDEYLLVRELAPTMIGCAMDLAFVAGMDQGTIRKLERRHLTATGIEFDRSKTGESQGIGWSDELRMIVDAALREKPQVRRYVICTRTGSPYSLNGFQSAWQRLMRKAKAAGLAETFHFHDLRAKSASDADSDQEAADRLGHKDAAMTRAVYRRRPRRAIPLRILDSAG
jgi:integrase